MIFLLSPSKTQDFQDEVKYHLNTQPVLKSHSLELVAELKKYNVQKLAKVLSISPKLAALNYERYQKFSQKFTSTNSRQALLAFRGDVYSGIEVSGYKDSEFSYAQKHLRILSGLYGLLRPLDLIQPYRLEMKTALSNPRGKNLYEFWGDRITRSLATSLQESGNSFLVNLASQEYFKAVMPEKLEAQLINIHFKEKKGKTLRVVGLFAKQARGQMANFAIRSRISKPEKLQDFSGMNYSFDEKLSSSSDYVFVR